MNKKRLSYTFLLPALWGVCSFLGYFHPGDEYGLWALSSMAGIWIAYFIKIGDIHNLMIPAGIALTGSGAPAERTDFCGQASQEPEGAPKSVLDWEPVFTRSSRAADLGYNFGPYSFCYPSADGRVRCSRGYFMTVWSRQPDGQWRFVFDGGNQCTAAGDAG